MYDPGYPLQIYCPLHHLLLQLAPYHGVHESFQ
jgi:hypothetical protein